MATVTDVEVANASFPNVRQDLNDILEALATNFSADAEPSTMYANQFWYETDTNLLKFRNEDNDAWVTLAYFDQTADEWEVRSAVMQAVDAAGLAFKTDEGTTRVSIADDGSVTVNTSLDVDNIKIDGNSITSTDTNGNINITPNGTGKVVLDGLSYPTADGTDGQVLTTDGSGNIAFEDASGGGITMADQFRLTTDLTGDHNPISTNLQRVDENVFGGIGTGMSESSGIFTFPSTGIYLIHFSIVVYTSSVSDYCRGYIRTTNNNSTYQAAATAYASAAGTGTPFNSGSTQFLFDVTDTTTHKVAFRIVQANTSNEIRGLTAENATFMTFIRLGDT